MSTIKAKNIKQTVIGGTTQPLKIGGILEDGSDAKISIDTSGNTTFSQVIGIKFPAIQVPSADANTLDDYEEGTFSPIIANYSDSTYVSFSNAGRYTKIGEFVYIQLNLYNVNISTINANGHMYLANLPFTTTKVWHAYNFSGTASGYPISLVDAVGTQVNMYMSIPNNPINLNPLTRTNYFNTSNITLSGQFGYRIQ